MFPVCIETNRLKLSPVHQEINPNLLNKYCSDRNDTIDEVTKYISWNKHTSMLESIRIFSKMREEWFNADTAHYAITHKQNSEFAGLCSLDLDHERNQGEIGVWLRKKYWGKKISKERAFALLELAFQTLELSSVLVVVAEDNKKSQKAVTNYISEVNGNKKCQMPDYHLFTDGTVKDSIIYSITKKQFESNRPKNCIKNLTW